MEIRVRDLKDLPGAAKQLLELSAGIKVFLFRGNMGAGKTTFIKAICEELGASDSISSPTYSLVNEYQSANGNIFHFDFFRIRSVAEAYDMGFEEYLYSNTYCFIEWPEKIEELWPANYIEVTIEQDEERVRKIKARRI
ncbi:tRNA (adenosine(37)-N6)-threonylcarbamoyltransferase complex ATPase subunit type 1 TsaE [Daejeonella lutea]|uniref:tRNA threonylcarbamoyladenosine biosynthesis protein TsaE n=1 Tax=Daejeonella lutea TaxID=572036 RepID=A0A1T5DLN4_9SPHI|nr:tRNA (adenosine(37)-N6)-threonylcarbamoyltransferase complex ATPase subunit type 1 TsaE [Daejeonella lutea]SKB72586.1 tRNA threonylcarbamoyladenosine biosynthesis protein TsaE [Daejeonella lutea]